MAVDFSSLVLGPAMDAFSRPMLVTPTASQPGQPQYSARGVWAFKEVEIQEPEGGVHSTNQPTMGIRLADFAVAPVQTDTAIVDAVSYEIVDVKLDGQGGADLWLRRWSAT